MLQEDKLVVSGRKRREARGWMKWVKGIGRYGLPAVGRTSHGDERHGVGNIANGIVTVLYGGRW